MEDDDLIWSVPGGPGDRFRGHPQLEDGGRKEQPEADPWLDAQRREPAPRHPAGRRRERPPRREHSSRERDRRSRANGPRRSDQSRIAAIVVLVVAVIAISVTGVATGASESDGDAGSVPFSLLPVVPASTNGAGSSLTIAPTTSTETTTVPVSGESVETSP